MEAGTNLTMAQSAVTAEHWLSKPVSAIDAATFWHALLTNGFDDKVQGSGLLLTVY
jgi:maleate isomerase